MQFDGFICTEVVMKKPFAILLAITLIMGFGLLLSSCEKSYDDKMFDFYRDTRDGQFNAIEINLGNDHSAIYFINERYGVWLNKGEKQLFDFDYVPEVQGGGELMIFIATQQSYYESIIQQNNGFASFYKGRWFSAEVASFPTTKLSLRYLLTAFISTKCQLTRIIP